MQTQWLSGCLNVSGEVSVRTLTQASYNDFMRQIRLPETQCINLKDVTLADSACVSLLLSVWRERSDSLNIRNVPQSVRDLAQLYEVDEWLKW